jgi:hypothetical protein
MSLIGSPIPHLGSSMSLVGSPIPHLGSSMSLVGSPNPPRTAVIDPMTRLWSNPRWITAKVPAKRRGHDDPLASSYDAMRRYLLLLASLALATTACSSSSSHAGAADAAAPGDAAPTTDDAGDETAAPCSAPPSQRPDGGTCVLDATGTVADLSATPLPDLVMTMCSPAICYGTRADDAGVYTVPIGDFIVTADYAVHADGRPDHAVDYHRLAAGEPQVIDVDMQIPTLPPSTVSLPPDDAGAPSSITVGDVTLQVAAGTTFDLDVEDYGIPAGRLFRVAAVPLASAPSYAAANNVAAIYAMAPSGATPSLPMGVSLRNAAALPASAGVDFLVLSDDYFDTPPTVGLLLVQATGHVSADGTTIATDPGQGITEITWLAVRQNGQ